MSEEHVFEDYTREEFFGFMEIPFHQYLGLEIFRPDEKSTSHICMPAKAERMFEGEVPSPAAVYTLLEMTAAMTAADLLDEHAPSVDREGMNMVVITTHLEFRYLRDGRGKITSRGRLLTDIEEAGKQMQARRRCKMVAATEVLDEDGNVLGEAEVHLYFRLMRVSGLVRAVAGGAGG
jgi:hypothetical protein